MPNLLRSLLAVALAFTPPPGQLPVRTLPVAADALDAVAGANGDLHVAYLTESRVYLAVQRAGQPAFDAAVEVPVTTSVGKWGGTVRIALAGPRVLVLAPVIGGFTLAASDDGRTWTSRPSRAVTGHAAVESQRIVAAGDTVHLVWIDEHAKPAEGDQVAKPIYLATSTDAGRTFGAPRAITAGFPAACPCCVPAVAAHGDALYVAYRTSVKNVKEVALLVSTDAGRSFTSRTVSADAWTMMGCPASGPELAVAGQNVTLTWSREKTLLRATSTDGGATFGKPAKIGEGRLPGRTATRVVLPREGAVLVVGKAE